MAAVQERNGYFRVLFRYRGKQHTFNLGKVERDEAEAKATHVEYLLMRLKQGFLSLPPGGDIVTFVEHDGSIPVSKDGQPAIRDTPTLGNLRDRYLKTHGNGTL